MRRLTNRHGFSLVELSIVLVILGLLTGGILAGQSLIRAAELRAVTTQFASYRAAAYSFRDKYFALPGDMTNATAFWLSAGGTGADATCFGSQNQASGATCNGDGDGLIYGFAGVAYAERFSAWKHLANAGLVEGSYSGKTNGAVGSYVTQSGVNVPPAKTGNAFFDFSWLDPASTFLFAGSKKGVNTITLYGLTPTYGTLKPEEAWNVDTKLDDGSPVFGSFFTPKKTSIVGTNCANSDADTAQYDLSNSNKDCFLFSVL